MIRATCTQGKGEKVHIETSYASEYLTPLWGEVLCCGVPELRVG